MCPEMNIEPTAETPQEVQKFERILGQARTL